MDCGTLNILIIVDFVKQSAGLLHHLSYLRMADLPRFSAQTSTRSIVVGLAAYCYSSQLEFQSLLASLPSALTAFVVGQFYICGLNFQG